MNVEIDIDGYLSESEKKELCVEYVRECLRGNDQEKERVLANMAYSAAFAILDSVLTEEMLEVIRVKVKKQIEDVSDFGIFRKKNAWGQEDSEAYLEVKKAVAEHKHLINGLVKNAILVKDYTHYFGENTEYVGEVLIDALKKGLEK